ncbi:MAG: RdgB/HAM1 family non-canonical purine NTP pyrophosphatase [Alphaproteobacteria bacterium]
MISLGKDARLVVASHNPGKVHEIADLFSEFGVNVIGAGELGLGEPSETGATFAANARLKAKAAANEAGLPALADDSGLCVGSLGGAPGVLSARWAGPKKDFAVAMKRVEDELAAKGAKNARAHFVCALAFAVPGGEIKIFEGRVDGTLTFPPRGTRGFGYDPIFVADGETMTFGEMQPEKKHSISHRARAFAKFVAALKLRGNS